MKLALRCTKVSKAAALWCHVLCYYTASYTQARSHCRTKYCKESSTLPLLNKLASLSCIKLYIDVWKSWKRGRAYVQSRDKGIGKAGRKRTRIILPSIEKETCLENDVVSQKIAFSLSLVWHNRSRFPASARPRIQRGLEGGDPYQRPGSEAAQCALRERTLADFLGFGRLPQLQPELRQVKYAKKISPYTPKGLVTHNSTDLYRHSELSCCELT